MAVLDRKISALKDRLRAYKALVVAFSGGVDSTFLLKVAHDVLKSSVLAVTARSFCHPERELSHACKLAEDIGARQVIIETKELDIPEFTANDYNRCYYCKKSLFNTLKKIAADNSIKYIADGTNADDVSDYRPGMKAADELNITSPLKEIGFSKNEIREASRCIGLATWDKPSFACLATRIPYGEAITKDKLIMVDRAEQFLLDRGLLQVRVRHHGNLARIEVDPKDRSKLFDLDLLDDINVYFKKIGFSYTAIDVAGYRTGKMNEALKVKGEI